MVGGTISIGGNALVEQLFRVGGSADIAGDLEAGEPPGPLRGHPPTEGDPASVVDDDVGPRKPPDDLGSGPTTGSGYCEQG